MKAANLIFPHQLFEKSVLLENGFPCFLIEEYLFFRQFNFHKLKIAFHRASMKTYMDYAKSKSAEIIYIDSNDRFSDIREFIPQLARNGVEILYYIDPCDDWLERRLKSQSDTCGIQLIEHTSPQFLNSKVELESFFKNSKKFYFQTIWYREQRQKRNILLDSKASPVGGKWSFDEDNRKRYPKNKKAPLFEFEITNQYYKEAFQYVKEFFPDNPGELSEDLLYPIGFQESQNWFEKFLKNRFSEFGSYEDAIVPKEHVLHHSVLTPMLNTGLLLPAQVIDKALKFSEHAATPINSIEAFVRQIIGWREFVRGVYRSRGRYSRCRNFWNFHRKIPKSFYDGTTGILPVDDVIKKLWKSAYCHHIERLMILGNFMLLCEFDPDDVYRWFMELFIDAYDWVMVPNVYGMSQFADGGIFATKPYISSSNYILKMSDYPKGRWQQVWDSLFWRFLHEHRSYFQTCPRLGVLVKNLDRMPSEKLESHLSIAQKFLRQLDEDAALFVQASE